MCLGVPGKIVEINNDEKWAIVEAMGIRNKIYTPLVEEELALGDYLMVHAGYAIGKLEKDEADETLRLLEEISKLSEAEE